MSANVTNHTSNTCGDFEAGSSLDARFNSFELALFSRLHEEFTNQHKNVESLLASSFLAHEERSQRIAHLMSEVLRKLDDGLTSARDIRRRQDIDAFLASPSTKTDTDLEEVDDAGVALELQAPEQMAAKAEVMVRSATADLISALPKKEPKRQGIGAQILMRLAPVFLLVIVLYVGWIYYVVDYAARHPREATPYHIKSIEIAFVSIFAFEVTLRLAVHRQYFFWTNEVHWNVIDFLLVAYSLVELALDNVQGNRFVYLRSLRVLRMTKVLRVFRLVKAVRQLRIMLHCLMGSFPSLLWSIIMITIVFCMFSMAFVQGVTTLLSHTDVDSDSNTVVLFGSIQASFLSLFKSVSGGQDWHVFYEALRPVGAEYTNLYLFYLAFSHIGLLNILTGIFVENALLYAHSDWEFISHRNRRHHQHSAERARRKESEIASQLENAEVSQMSL